MDQETLTVPTNKVLPEQLGPIKNYKKAEIMKIFALNGSPRKHGNTNSMLTEVLSVCQDSGYQIEIFQTGILPIRGCMACGSCGKKHGVCAIDDWVNEVYQKMKAADAILIGSPTYFADLTPAVKAVIERCGYVSRNDGMALSRKVGAAVSAVRRCGGIHALDSIQHFFLINDMIIPGSTYWNMSLSRDLNDFEKDEEGKKTMRRLGENIVWLLEKIRN